MKEFPLEEFERKFLKKTLMKMEGFRIIRKVRARDGLHVYSIAIDLINEDVEKPFISPVLKKRKVME